MVIIAWTGATWRAGSALSELKTLVKGQGKQIDDLEDHVEEHDRWHRDRLSSGKDDK